MSPWIPPHGPSPAEGHHDALQVSSSSVSSSIPISLSVSRQSEAIINSPDLVYLLTQCTQEVDGLLHIAIQSPYSPIVTCLKHLLETLNKAQLVRNQQVIFALIREALEGLFKALTFQMESDILIRFRDVYLFVLRCLQECKALGVSFVALHVTLALLEQRPEHRYYLPIIDLLARLHMVEMREIDGFVAKEIERQDNSAILFGTHIVKVLSLSCCCCCCCCCLLMDLPLSPALLAVQAERPYVQRRGPGKDPAGTDSLRLLLPSAPRAAG